MYDSRALREARGGYLYGGVATIVVPDTDRLGHVTASIFS
jgi:hypothetical protein